MEHFGAAIPSLRQHILKGDFRIYIDDKDGLTAEWVNTNILDINGKLSELIGNQVFNGNYRMKSTMIGIVMIARKGDVAP